MDSLTEDETLHRIRISPNFLPSSFRIDDFMGFVDSVGFGELWHVRGKLGVVKRRT